MRDTIKTISHRYLTFVRDDHRTWDVHLSKIQFAINNHGRELVTCGSHYIDNYIPNELVFLPRQHYGENLGHLAGVFDNVKATLWHSHNIGDTVWKNIYV